MARISSKKPEKSTLKGRVRRYARVTSTATGLAARMAGEKYLGFSIDRPKHAQQLMQSLGDLKGPLLKVAQLLATIPNALPREYALELQKLQSQAPPMSWPFVRRRMASELGPRWEEYFHFFDKTAAAAASLGQVHKAVTARGESVACKLQYPDMESAVDADLRQLKMFLKVFESYDKSLVTADIQKEIAERLHEELDYVREKKHVNLYGMMLKDEAGVHVPRVIDNCSTDRLLTTTWLEGQPILGFKKAPQNQRNTIAHNMFRAWYVPLYYYGVIHGDPHLGNYTVCNDMSINLLDFGCVRVFPAHFVEGVIKLYRALQEDDDDLAVEAYKNWGFEHLNKKMLDVLNTWARFLYGPVLDDKVRTIGAVPDKGVYGRDTALKVHRELKAAGGIKVPREFVFMDRAALGLGSVFLHLDSKINWHRLFNELIEGFDVQELARRQKRALKNVGLT